MTTSVKEQLRSTALFGSNANDVEALYERFMENPDAVPEGWRRYFRSIADTAGGREVAHSPIRQRLARDPRSSLGKIAAPGRQTRQAAGSIEKQAAVSRLIQVHSLRGHQVADIDPLSLMDRHVHGMLKLDCLGLTEADMESEFHTGGLAGTGNRRMKLRDILQLLRKIYSGKIGAEFAHISRSRER